MRRVRIGRRPIPKSLRGREYEILGEVRGGTMIDCVYNDLISAEDQFARVKPESIKHLLPSFVKDYQVDDLSKAITMDAVFNINKPGLGKTLETILWIKLKLGKGFKALILCPKTVVSTWHSQLTRFWPGWEKDGMWYITNYEQLYDEERFAIAQEFYWDVIVLDESHKIKSMKSKVNEIVFKLRSHYRHCLTGTPIKNRPEDIAAQLKWLDPYSITSFTDFREAFSHKIRTRHGVVYKGLTKDKKMVDNLQKLLDLYCVGGRDIPAGEPGERIFIKLKLDDKVRRLYRKVEGEWDPETEQVVIDVESLLEEGIKVSGPTESAIRRQQLASNPGLFGPKLNNVKFEWILDWLDGSDEKVIIVSRFAKTIEALEKLLASKKKSFITMKQSQSIKMRDFVIDKFRKDKQALLATYGLIKEGTDGLQEIAHYAIMIDRNYNSTDNDQFEGRIERTGQKLKPYFYILQAVGTIDIKIERIQNEKDYDIKTLLEPLGEDEDE